MGNDITNDELIRWLKVLTEGYVKPDVKSDTNGNTSGVIRDTKNFMPVIWMINEELATRAKMGPIKGIDSFKIIKKSIYEQKN